jgi:hypothetical protein
MQNPALMQVLQQRISPVKQYMMFLRAKGIDPKDLEPDPNEMPLDPMLMQGQAGNPQGAGAPPNPAQGPGMPSPNGPTPPNEMGVRGIQQP